ncbi:hypothetical protein RB195_000232 [Necator americanus]|uniref:Dynactin subunit 4 n=1 Tax=Necator americanus TaxID=51031 RepID=A0ABR1DA28_NECAM
MASLFQMERVLYQCGCDNWWPLCNLYFCRHCSSLRCISCSLNEIDSTFCPNCLENIPAGEARVKRNRCVNCNQCPICSMVLTTRAVGESCHLMCSTCRWSTRDSDTPDQPSSINWPVHETTLDKDLGEALERMRVLAAAEKAQRDQVKLNKSDRITSETPLHVPSEDVPELSLADYLEDGSDVISPSLDSRLRQPLACGRLLRPVRMPLKARRAVRCKHCDHNLVKLEYGTSTIRYKIQYFARNFVPEIRLSREPELSDSQSGSVFLTVANESNSKAEVILLADNRDDTVECLTPVVELTLPSSDETADIYDIETDRRNAYESSGAVVFRRRHRAGIRVEVKGGDDKSAKVLSLLVKYRNEQCFMNMNTAPEWKVTRVRVSLTSSE